MHTVRALLIPDDSNLPVSAAARGPGEESTAETEVEAVTSKDLPGARTAASDWYSRVSSTMRLTKTSFFYQLQRR